MPPESGAEVVPAPAGLRLFVAVPLPPDVVRRARAVVTRLAERGDRVRWVDSRQLHLTLSFLGDDVPEDRVPAITAAIAHACRGSEPFAIACGGLGRFPPRGRPRVVWLGVTEGVDHLVRLQAAVARQLEPLGFPREARAWQPHVTLGRLPDGGRFAAGSAERLEAAITAESDAPAGGGTVEQVILYASDRTPVGPVHRPLATIRLAGA